MKSIVFKMIFAFIFVALFAATGKCAAEGMAYREERQAVLRQSECQAPEGAVVQDVWFEASPLSKLSTKVTLGPGEYLRVVMACAGGTGYQWQITDSKVSFLETVKTQVLPFPKSEHIAGGKVAYIFLFKASPAAVGDDHLTYALQRSWEGAQKGDAVVEMDVHYTTAR